LPEEDITGLMTQGRPVLPDRRAQQVGVEHGKDFARVGNLHRRRVGIAVACDDMAAEALGGDDELLTELARAQQQELCGECHELALPRVVARHPS
jgi:hypothetical protein